MSMVIFYPPARPPVEEAAAGKAAAVTAGTSLEPPQPKYATVEKAEKGIKEAETRMHTATEETAREWKAREAAEAKAEAAEKELEDLKAAQTAAAAELVRWLQNGSSFDVLSLSDSQESAG